jgi:cytochrome c oxidase cbb3-type subunit 3
MKRFDMMLRQLGAACRGAGLRAGLVALFAATSANLLMAQDQLNPSPQANDNSNDNKPALTTPKEAGEMPTPENLLKVPITTLTPGAIDVRPKLKHPPLDQAAAERGMSNFASFNCVGCHMGNGGGGMGPSLSDRFFIYGAEPENIFLSIYQGRPYGMPAWGTILPDDAIWDLVAYIKNLSDAPVTQWGTTVSKSSPAIEQVPIEFKAAADPWHYTQKFSKGQKPSKE